jgi:hypothetical protein
MQGYIIPSGWDKEIVVYNDGNVLDRDCCMPWFGQVSGGYGTMVTYETPYDAKCRLSHIPGGDTSVAPSFIPSLGIMGYTRILRYNFFEHCSYNTFCAAYRTYLKDTGQFVSLQEKILKNPAIFKLIGTPVYHDVVYKNVQEKSDFYDREHTANNKKITTFREIGQRLTRLHGKGVGRVYLHIDGWGKNGYDNDHPFILPPCEQAGGYEGLKELKSVCEGYGDLLVLHDNYRDYFYSGDGFTFDDAVTNIDDSHPHCSIWYGGDETLLCAKNAVKFVSNNYALMAENGFSPDGAYLDVFSAVELDQCFHPEHMMTREECARARRECLRHINDLGIIPSSEEAIDCIISEIPLCHHAPYALVPNPLGGQANGVPVPLINLVYHDSIIIPWICSRKHGGWGIPDNHSAYAHAALNAGPVYIDGNINDEYLSKLAFALELQKKLAFTQMTEHVFLDSSYEQQQTTYADGTVVYANVATGEVRCNP